VSEPNDGRRTRLFALEALAASLLLVGAGAFLWLNSRADPAATNDPAAATGDVPTADPREKSGWKLTFADEFDGETLDPDRWIDSYPDGKRTHANNEQQYYEPGGARVAGGLLRFTAERRVSGGMPYTSGMACTHGKFAQKYGWFEVRARFPKGRGMWPAFWLLPETKAWPPEIDVLEILGHEPDVVLMTNHWGRDFPTRRYRTGKWKGPDFSADFHTFAAEWGPGKIIWYVDGVERHRTTEGVPAEPMYVLVNLAVGGDLPGMPDATTPFPGVMEVDYVRAYARTTPPTPPAPPVPR
jgi:beta-glucanase (GH16 family)